MNFEKNDSVMEAALLATFLGDEEVRKLSRNVKFRAHLLGQKKVIADLLKNSFELSEGSGVTNADKDSTVYKTPSASGLTSGQVLATSSVVYKPSPKATSASPLNSEKLLQEVVSIFAEKTGYPEDMLGAELDLEADLGIDTVKQMEILGLIRKKYNLALKENFSLKQTPSLAAIVKMIEQS